MEEARKLLRRSLGVRSLLFLKIRQHSEGGKRAREKRKGFRGALRRIVRSIHRKRAEYALLGEVIDRAMYTIKWFRY